MKEYIVAPKYLWDGRRLLEDVAILVRDGVIAGIDSLDALKASSAAEVERRDDWFVLPAFTDAHDHGRGMSPVVFGAWDNPLEVWLQDLNRLPAIPHYDACWYDGCRLASCGVGMVMHSHNPNSFAKIADEMVDTAHGYMAAGIRSILAPLYIDQNKRIYYERDAFIASLPEPVRTAFANGIHDRIMTIDEYFALVDEIRSRLSKEIEEGWTEVQLHPNGGQWCSDEALLAMKEYARKNGMYIHLHLLETMYQREYAMRTWGKNYIKHYADIGFLGPWVSFAHSVWMDDEDLDLIAASGAKLVTNPSSNLRLRSGSFRMKDVLRRHIVAGIGLDGCAFDDDQDYLREMRVAWLNNSSVGIDAQIDSHEILKMATSLGAQVSASGLCSGRLAVGEKADYVCIDMNAVRGPYCDADLDPAALLVQKGVRSCVDRTVLGGNTIWQKGDERFESMHKDAEKRICDSIRTLRSEDPGKRDNSLIMDHIIEFYTKGAGRIGGAR